MTGKVALITGSAKGLGRAFAHSLLTKGLRVMISDTNTLDGEKTLADFQKEFSKTQVSFQKCDVTNPEDFDTLFQAVNHRFNGLDLVCNNAGIIHENEWEKMINVNLFAMITGTKLAVNYMSKINRGNGGVVINISSAAGLQPVPFSPVYCATKSGIINFSRSMALHPDYLKHNIRINCLCPFYTKTDMLKLHPDQVIGIDVARKALQLVGIIQIENVVSAFNELWENETFNGEVMQISVNEKKLIKFPATGFEFLTKKPL